MAKKQLKRSQAKPVTREAIDAELRGAYRAKSKLLERQQEDYRYAMGEQWTTEEKETLRRAGFKAYVDNRIQPNLFLLTGLERQNRTDIRVFPEGEEDGLAADIATALVRDALKKSGYAFKKSEQFKDGITCGESHLEPYLDFTASLINGKLCWRKSDNNTLFVDPSSREYDLSDARYVFKVTHGIAREDLLNLYGDDEKVRKAIEEAKPSTIDYGALANGGSGEHVQKRDYDTKEGGQDAGEEETGQPPLFDLVERYYKKWITQAFIGDKKTGEITQAETPEKAQAFLANYLKEADDDQAAYERALGALVQAEVIANPALATFPAQAILEDYAGRGGQLPPPPPERDPQRYIAYTREVPEIWCYAYTPGIKDCLADERAWSYPKYKGYPFVTYYARFSTAPLEKDDRHLRVQGLVHGVKGAQEIHNKSAMLMMRHLNTSTNSGWIAEEGAWVDPSKVEQLGSTPSVNLEYKKGFKKPDRIEPAQLSTGHGVLAQNSAQAIKEQLGINADLLATQEGGSQSGRAIALRQRQGLLMVQEPLDNLSRSCETAGRIVLSQLGEMYDTETAMKVLGAAFLRKHFPVPMLPNPEKPGEMMPVPDRENPSRPMPFDKKLAEIAIAEVLNGDLETYDVSVGEVVASESMQMARAAEIKDLATAGVPIPPEMLVRYSQAPESAKTEILSYIEKAQALRAAPPPARPAAPQREPAAGPA